MNTLQSQSFLKNIVSLIYFFWAATAFDIFGTDNAEELLTCGCAITTISTTGPIYAKSSDFYAKLNVSNLKVTKLY